MALQVTDDNYKAIIAEGKPVVIDFWAPWCTLQAGSPHY